MSWIAAKALIVESTVWPRADAIVVMSGSSAYKERSDLAAQLFRQSQTAIVVLTNDGQQGGWSNEKQRNPYSYELATDELVRLGVPQSNIKVLPTIVTGTYEEALELRDWIVREKIGSIMVVTSVYHSKRTKWTLNKVLPNDSRFAVVTVPPGEQTPAPTTWWWYPSGWRSVAGEYVKLAYYVLHY